VQAMGGMGHGREKEMKEPVRGGQHEHEQVEVVVLPEHFQGGPARGQGGAQLPGQKIEIRGPVARVGLDAVAGQPEVVGQFGRVDGPVQVGFREAGDDGAVNGRNRRGAGQVDDAGRQPGGAQPVQERGHGQDRGVHGRERIAGRVDADETEHPVLFRAHGREAGGPVDRGQFGQFGLDGGGVAVEEALEIGQASGGGQGSGQIERKAVEPEHDKPFAIM